MVREEAEGGGGVVPMSDVNFDVYPLSLSFKVLDENYFIPLEKVPIYFVFSKYISYGKAGKNEINM